MMESKQMSEVPKHIQRLMTPLRNMDEAENCKVLAKDSNAAILAAYKLGQKKKR
jgi:hypothetical protein